MNTVSISDLQREIKRLKLACLLLVALPLIMAFQTGDKASGVSSEVDTHKLVVSDAAGHVVFQVYVDQYGYTNLIATAIDGNASWGSTLRPYGVGTPSAPAVANEFLGADRGAGGITSTVQGHSGNYAGYATWGVGYYSNGVNFDTGQMSTCSPPGTSPTKRQSTPPKLAVNFGNTASAQQTYGTWSTPAWATTPCH